MKIDQMDPMKMVFLQMGEKKSYNVVFMKRKDNEVRISNVIENVTQHQSAIKSAALMMIAEGESIEDWELLSCLVILEEALKEKTYVTFGQVHMHEIDGVVFDKDCVAVVDGDREVVMKLFGRKFCTTYTEIQYERGDLEMSYFPRGTIQANSGEGS